MIITGTGTSKETWTEKRTSHDNNRDMDREKDEP
jgi:hypothetical protein